MRQLNAPADHGHAMPAYDPRFTLAATILCLAGSLAFVAVLFDPYFVGPSQPAEAAGGQSRLGVTAAVPRPGDLTFGGFAGDILVGLTLRPGQPGSTSVYLLVQGGVDLPPATRLPADLTVEGQEVPVVGCGVNCFRGQVARRGGERFTVRVPIAQGGTVEFETPNEPAPDGLALIDRMRERMRVLRTFRTDEITWSATPPLRATDAYQLPDRLSLTFQSGQQMIWIGNTRHTRDSARDAWQTDVFAITPTLPSFPWDDPQISAWVAPRRLGTTTVDGVGTEIVSVYALNDRLPLWFRFYVDEEGLVHRSEMRAPGHVMDLRYYDFDAPFTVQLPPPND